jgi:hypothetical protein
MLSKNLLTPWTIDLFGCPVIVRQPHWTKRVWPVVLSIPRAQRQWGVLYTFADRSKCRDEQQTR